MRESLIARGVISVGDLAAMPPSALERLPFIGPAKLARLRGALRRLAGRERVPDSLSELDNLLKEELGERTWQALGLVIGLHDGKTRSLSEVATALGVS